MGMGMAWLSQDWSIPDTPALLPSPCPVPSRCFAGKAEEIGCSPLIPMGSHLRDPQGLGRLDQHIAKGAVPPPPSCWAAACLPCEHSLTFLF